MAPTASLMSWAMEHVRLRDQEYTFRDYPFMAELHRASDYAKKISIMKSAQCGGSLWGTCETLYQCDAHGLSVIYYFPTNNAIGTHVREKVDTIIGASTYLRGRTQDRTNKKGRVENVHQKKIGKGFGYWRGAKSRLARESTPADIVFLDERDHFEEEWVPDIMQRMNASPLKLYREIGKPTLVGAPIHRAYEASNKMTWMLKCNHCGVWSEMDWFRDFVVEDKEGIYELRDRDWLPWDDRQPYIYCHACNKPRDRFVPEATWVAKESKVAEVGFHISRLMTRTAPLNELWQVFHDAYDQGDQITIGSVYNGHLGLPYTPDSAGLTDALLDACKRQYVMPEKIVNPQVICTAGFDVQGEYLVGRISQIIYSLGVRIRRAVWIGRVTWDKLDDLLARYPIKLAVIDGAYDATMGKRCRERHEFIWLASYPNMKAGSDWLRPNPVTRWIEIERTQSLDRSHRDLLTERNHLPHNAAGITHFYEEMKNAVRVEEEDAKGNRKFVWKKVGDHDDYRHSDNYDFVAAELMDRGFLQGPVSLRSGRSYRQAAMEKITQRSNDLTDRELVEILTNATKGSGTGRDDGGDVPEDS